MALPMRAVYRAREEFLAEGELRDDLVGRVRPEVLTSWRRSRLSGADSDATTLHYEDTVIADSSLCVAADPILTRLAERFSGLRAGVLLANRDARIIRRYVAPDAGIAAMMDRILSVVGSSGSEEFVGTNGIGTVAEERRARMIVGPEHFAQSLSGFTCVGAPIYHPLTRKLEGVVTLNSDVDSASPLLTPLMTSTAQEIEHRMLDLASQRERMLLDTFLTANRAGGSVAVVSQDVFMAGPRAQRLLEGIDHSLIWEYASEAVLSPHEGRASRAILMPIPTSTRVVALRCSPLLIDGRLAGALLEVDEGADVATALAPASAGLRADQRRHSARQHQLDDGSWPESDNKISGRSASWQRVIEAARIQRHSALPLVVSGEPGTGKLTLLKAMFGDHLTVLDCVAALDDRISWLGRLRDALGAGTENVLVLRHLDAVDEEIANGIASHLNADGNPSPRVVATTTKRDWAEQPAQRRLLDQLAVAHIDLPPLRERRDDIKEMISRLTEQHAPGGGLRISQAAIQAMTRAQWPGNIRQLESVVRGLIHSAGQREVTVEMLPAELGQYSSRRVLTTMEQVELDAIMTAVRNSNGNKVVAARLLGISRSTLYRKMRTYRLDPDKHFF